MKLLCKIGFHYWRFVGYSNLLLSDSLEECRHCGAGRILVSYGAATVNYTPAQMREYKEARDVPQ